MYGLHISYLACSMVGVKLNAYMECKLSQAKQRLGYQAIAAPCQQSDDCQDLLPDPLSKCLLYFSA